MPRQILPFLADNITQPLLNAGIIYVIVINPVLIARVVGGIYVDAPNPPSYCGSKDLRAVRLSP